MISAAECVHLGNGHLLLCQGLARSAHDSPAFVFFRQVKVCGRKEMHAACCLVEG